MGQIWIALWVNKCDPVFNLDSMHHSQDYTKDFCQSNPVIVEMILYCNVAMAFLFEQYNAIHHYFNNLLTVLLQYINSYVYLAKYGNYSYTHVE